MTTYQGYIGRAPGIGAVYVEIKISEQLGTNETVTHGVISKYTRVSIRGHYFEPGSRRKDYAGVGQIVDTAAAVSQPAPGLGVTDIGRLVDVWRSWHLNDLRAGCAHQTEIFYEDSPYGRRVDLKATPACPETGYRYGSAWLVEEVPADVVEWLHKFGQQLDGTDGLRA